MAYTAKLFGGPAHGQVSVIPNETRNITVESWINPIMPYEEWEALEVKTEKTEYLRMFNVVDKDDEPIVGYFFVDGSDHEYGIWRDESVGGSGWIRQLKRNSLALIS